MSTPPDGRTVVDERRYRHELNGSAFPSTSVPPLGLWRRGSSCHRRGGVGSPAARHPRRPHVRRDDDRDGLDDVRDGVASAPLDATEDRSESPPRRALPKPEAPTGINRCKRLCRPSLGSSGLSSALLRRALFSELRSVALSLMPN